MTILEAVVLGVVQGITELLPISRSAHLALTPYLLGWSDPGLAFDVALHFGTLLALCWYFRVEWLAMLASAWYIARTRRVDSVHDRRLVYLMVATIPAGLGGLLLQDLAETTFRSPLVIAVALAVMGVLLWWIDRRSVRARAIEASAFVIAAAQVGNHEDGRQTYGHSLVVDPWGEVLLDMGGEAPGLAFCDIDLSRIADVRAQVPALANRREIPKS